MSIAGVGAAKRGPVKVNPVTGALVKTGAPAPLAPGQHRDGAMIVDDRYINAAKELGLGNEKGASPLTLLGARGGGGAGGAAARRGRAAGGAERPRAAGVDERPTRAGRRGPRGSHRRVVVRHGCAALADPGGRLREPARRRRQESGLARHFQ